MKDIISQARFQLHKKMIRSIIHYEIQPSKILSEDQYGRIQQIERKAKWIAKYIDDNQRIQWGVGIENIKKPNLGNQALQEYFDILGEYWWRFFQCLIYGEKHLMEKASQQNLRIPSSPREFFSEILRQGIMDEIDEAMGKNVCLSKEWWLSFIKIEDALINDKDLYSLKKLQCSPEALIKYIQSGDNLRFWVEYHLSFHPEKLAKNSDFASALFKFRGAWKDLKRYYSQKGKNRSFKASSHPLVLRDGQFYLQSGQKVTFLNVSL